MKLSSRGDFAVSLLYSSSASWRGASYHCWSLASESIMASIQTHNPRPQQGGLLAGFKIQRNVVAALFMREVLTRFGRHTIGFLWMFVEPMIDRQGGGEGKCGEVGGELGG